ncbi:MAG: hypothetical protein ACLRSW_16420 [Christensenellaceae bacterium]
MTEEIVLPLENSPHKFSKLLKKENSLGQRTLVSDKNDSKISITNENISDFLFLCLFWTSMRSSILSMNPDIFCCSSMVGMQ